MSATQREFEDSREMSDCQLKFLQSLFGVLHEHQKVLPALPEMCKRLITVQTNAPKEPYDNSNFDLSREDEKDILARRKCGDLVKHLKDQLAEKEERIAILKDEMKKDKESLEKMLSDKDKHYNLLYEHCKTQEQNYKLSNDKYIAELRAKEDELKQYRERIAGLEGLLNSKESMLTTTRVTSLESQPTSKQTVSTMTEVTSIENQPISKQTVSTMTDNERQEDSESLKKMEGEFKATILERDEELKELKQSFNQMDKQYQSIISAKDEELKKSNYSFHQMKESLNKEIHTKHEELHQVKSSFHNMKEEAKSIISARNEELNQLKCRQREQKEKFKALWESKGQELREVKMRLAHLSENLMKKDQRKVEDTAAANRPSEVENDFKEFFDNERMDAIDKMQQVYGSEEESDIGISYPRLACMILEAAYEQTIEIKESALHVFKEIVNIMIEEAPEQGQKYLSVEKNKYLSYRVNFKMPTCRQEMKYPTEVVDAFVLSLKETAHLCSLESLEEGVRKKITDKWVSWLSEEKSCKFSFSHRMLCQLKDYTQACIRITWRMIIQVPPMQLEYKSTTLKNFHKKVGYHSDPEMCSRPPPNGQESVADEIACYLWPALLDGGGRIIQAGEVLCKVEAQAK